MTELTEPVTEVWIPDHGVCARIEPLPSPSSRRSKASGVGAPISRCALIATALIVRGWTNHHAHTHAVNTGGSKRIFGQLELPLAALPETAGSSQHRYVFIMQFPMILSNELLELVPGSVGRIVVSREVQKRAMPSAHTNRRIKPFTGNSNYRLAIEIAPPLPRH
jgi:hypothetical protein